jgi:hypothetical protein
VIQRRCLSSLLVAWAGLAFADFVPDDQIVSDPTSDLPAPEFDRRTGRVIWQDRQNKLWVGNVDPVTGALNPVDGRGQVVDTALASVGQVGNTPRYTYGGDQAAIVYTKLSGTDFQLAEALETAPDTWQITLLTNGLDRWRPEGTPEETIGPAMIAYNREAPSGNVVVSWRELADPGASAPRTSSPKVAASSARSPRCSSSTMTKITLCRSFSSHSIPGSRSRSRSAIGTRRTPSSGGRLNTRSTSSR